MALPNMVKNCAAAPARMMNAEGADRGGGRHTRPRTCYVSERRKGEQGAAAVAARHDRHSLVGATQAGCAGGSEQTETIRRQGPEFRRVCEQGWRKLAAADGITDGRGADSGTACLGRERGRPTRQALVMKLARTSACAGSRSQGQQACALFAWHQGWRRWSGYPRQGPGDDVAASKPFFVSGTRSGG